MGKDRRSFLNFSRSCCGSFLFSSQKSNSQRGLLLPKIRTRFADKSREREFLCGKINEPAATNARCNRKNSNRKTKPSIVSNRPLRNGKGVEGWVNFIFHDNLII